MVLIEPGTTWQEAFDQVKSSHLNAADTAANIRTEITTVLNNIADGITTPTEMPSWGTLSGGALLRSDWGAAWSAPSAVSVQSVSGPAAIEFGTVGTPATMGTATAPTWTETLPDEPGDAPTISEFTVEELGSLVLPPFTITVPTEDIGPLVAPFEFTNERYVGRMDGRVEAVLNRVLDGEPIIGSDVFDALQGEAQSDAAATYREAMQTASTTCGMLGELPGEALVSRFDAATGEYRKALQKIDTTFKIEASKAWREDLWKGVDAANAYEKLWMDLHVQEIGRLLTAATATVQAAGMVYNANIARWNAMLAQVNAHIAVAGENRARVLMELEWHKEKLATAIAALQVSDLKVRAWLGQWEGYKAAATAKTTVFGSKVQAFSATVDQNKSVAALSAEAVKVMIEREQGITARFAADWAALSNQASAVAALTQAHAIPAELQIKSESGRQAAEAQALALVEQDVRTTLDAGKAEAMLAMEYVKFREAMSQHDRDAMLNALANMYGAERAAAQTNLGASVSSGASVSNSSSISETASA